MDKLSLLHFRFSPRRSWLMVALMPLLGVALAMLGPFGTYVSMTTVARGAHFIICFTVIGLLSIEGAYRVARLGFQGRWPVWAALLFDLACIVPSTAVVWASLKLLAPSALAYVNIGELSAQNALIFLLMRVGIVAAALWRNAQLGEIRPERVVASAPDTDDPVSARLPFALKGAQILALTAEDHYLRVYTSRGEALIHLTLAEAVERREGFQVHRSHWISGRALKGYDPSRVHLVTGTSFPLSRHRRKAFETWVSEAGITPA